MPSVEDGLTAEVKMHTRAKLARNRYPTVVVETVATIKHVSISRIIDA